jgi:phage tail-like protein
LNLAIMVNSSSPYQSFLLRAASSAAARLQEESGVLPKYDPAIELSWDIPLAGQPTFPDPDDPQFSCLILRRERRFPGKKRKGVIPVTVAPDDESLQDGEIVYDTANFHYDWEETQKEQLGNQIVTTIRQYRYRLAPQEPQDRILIRSIRQESEGPATNGELVPKRMAVQIFDRQGLKPGTIYYYTAFVGPEEDRYFSRHTQASALATGYYGHALFSTLPQIHQRFDTNLPPPDSVPRGDRHKGQLQRFLEVFESHADLLHGQINGLRDLHAPRRVDSRLLPHLAHLIGWRPRDYLNEDQQRNEISFAPEIYKTVGTIPTIAATINRLIGWKARIREFARNVLLSFDASRLESRLDGVVYLDGTYPPPRYPAGSIDTGDAKAIAKLRSKAWDDLTAYSYDFGLPDGRGGYIKDDQVLYNRETIGIYLARDVESEVFTLEEATERIRKLLQEFLPIQVRVVFFLDLPVVEEAYNTIEEVTEEREDVGVQILQEEGYREVLETFSARIPGWQVLVANYRNHRTTDLRFRTWHSALEQEIAELPTDID